jgi:hypothetical protein
LYKSAEDVNAKFFTFHINSQISYQLRIPDGYELIKRLSFAVDNFTLDYFSSFQSYILQSPPQIILCSHHLP